MDHAALVFESVREVIIETLKRLTGFLRHQAIFDALMSQGAVAFGQIGLDSAARREFRAAIEAKLGVTIAELQVGADDTIDALARDVASRLSPAMIRALLP